MAQNITLLGASYSDVPAVDLPKTGGGTARFADASVTTAVAEDVASGKVFLLADGSVGTGSASGGGGTDYLAIKMAGGSATYENNDITQVAQYALFRWSGLTDLSLPNCTKILDCACQYCTGFTHLFFENLTTTTTNTFANCTNLETFVSKKAIYSSGGGDFGGNTKMHSFDMGDGSGRFPGNCFKDDTVLTTVVIRSSTVAVLASTNSFTNTPFASGKSGGILYVPADLVSSYQSASNWSTILGYTNNQIKSIESTHTDPTAPIDLTLYYADGTPIS